MYGMNGVRKWKTNLVLFILFISFPKSPSFKPETIVKYMCTARTYVCCLCVSVCTYVNLCIFYFKESQLHLYLLCGIALQPGFS